MASSAAPRRHLRQPAGAGALSQDLLAHARPLIAGELGEARKIRNDRSYLALAGAAPGPPGALESGTNWPCTRPDLALVSIVASPVLRS